MNKSRRSLTLNAVFGPVFRLVLDAVFSRDVHARLWLEGGAPA